LENSEPLFFPYCERQNSAKKIEFLNLIVLKEGREGRKVAYEVVLLRIMFERDLLQLGTMVFGIS